MKIRLIAIGFCLGAASALATSTVLSQDRQDQPPQQGMPDPAEMARMMQMWEEVSTPGEQHRKLNAFVGEWDTVTKVWMGGAAPGAQPMESTGSASTEWVLGDRFIRMEYEGSMMGRPFTGIGYTGFDNYKKKYVSSWMDSMGTAMHTSEGLLDQTGNVLTFYGTMDEWLTGEHDKAVKYVNRIIDEDTHVFEMHDLGIVPGETKVVEITYRRRK